MGYRAAEMYFARAVVILHYIATEKIAKSIFYQRLYAIILYMLGYEWRESSQEAVGEWFTIYAVDDFGRCKFVFV